MSESEGDAEAWRSMKRVMVSYFLASNLQSQNSQYAMYTMLDLVQELAASPRTQARMHHSFVVNLSGNIGSGIFYDKFCEICVRSIKTCLRNCHGRVDNLLVEKMLNGLSVITSVCEHDRNSLLKGKTGKEKSHDFVGNNVRGVLEELVMEQDPFNRERVGQTYYQKPRGSPYAGLVESDLTRFLLRMSEVYRKKY